ncbi:PIN domain-like protein [Lentinus brumalis]|uniref:PIN domain-like protein n=1 Tax=Lentinus brumalis TaxID=2498619 RepID=A0A371CM92_9APHY|nr:PIN domain-like protein [Polyporus brumalis]
MGVHGLTTYLRENKHVLSRTVQLLQQAELQHIPVVVDAWSFIYEIIYCADLPWVYGGEYLEFARLVREVVRAWTEVGLELHFVFDGPYPTLKFPTLVSRITQTHIQSGLLFFRTSATARATPRFLHETAMLPPLAYSVCVATLLHLARSEQDIGRALHVHFADEEGDPYAVALAGRLNAYVAGRDSDFVVLNAEGYRGYIPLDEMVWTVTTTWDGEGSVYSASVSGETEMGSAFGDDDGFQTVRKGKSKRKRADKQDHHAGRGILPASALGSAEPQPDGQLGLSFAVYDPSVLATHLGIPVSLLPLLGAFLGNDFTGASGSDDAGPPPVTTAEIRAQGRSNLQRLFFERGLTHGQRIARVAGTLSEILAAAFGGVAGGGRKRGKRQAIGSVMELIDAAVTALLVRPLDTFATGEREAVVERIAEATLQYAIPKADDGGAIAGVQGYDVGEEEVGLRWASDVCPLHAPEACPMISVLSGLIRSRDAALDDELEVPVCAEDPLEQVKDRYVAAYRQGVLDPHILDTAHTGTMWPRMFLEDPDKETVQRTVGRPVRMWTYAVLDAGIGLPNTPEPESESEPEDQQEEDEDELVDVVEEDESDEEAGADPLARLRGALKELDGDAHGTDVPHPVAMFAVPQNSRPKVITEHLRRGTRLVGEEVTVPPLAELLKSVSLDIPHDLVVPPQLWPEETRRAVLLNALVSSCPGVSSVEDEDLVGVLAVRWVVRTMHIRAQENPGVKERIVERWTQAEAKAVLASFSSHQDVVNLQPPEADEGPALPLERHIQLVTQVSTAVDAIEQLTQVLLLSSTIGSPARRFSGSRCHALLSGRLPLPPGQPSEEVWSACLEGLDDAYSVLPQKKKDKKAKAHARAAAAAAPATGKSAGRGVGAARGGMFGLLEDVDA